ncbi:MAG: hypothetical protein ACI9EF_003949 [Pseudohongiellaceae bacterium]|jgi:hypothetical protein
MGYRIVAALLLAGLTACAPWPIGEAGVLSGQTLTRGAAILVMTVPDQKLSVDEFVENSGVAIVRSTRRQLAGVGCEAFANNADTLADAFSAARDLGCELVAQAEIIEWRDQGANWVRGGDRLAVLLKLWSVEDRAMVAWGAEDVEDKTMVSGIEPPHRLAEELMKKIVNEIFAPGATVSQYVEQ